MKKKQNITNLSKICQKEKKAGRKIVICHGVFDLLHVGHIKHFQKAKSLGDILIVSITADKFVNKGPFTLFLVSCFFPAIFLRWLSKRLKTYPSPC